MARISIRELFRFRHTVLSSPTKLSPLFPSPFCLSTCRERNLKQCQSIRQLVQIHAHLITHGLFHDPFWANRVLLHASEFGDIDYTLCIFRCVKVPNTFCINRVIKAYSISSVPDQALVFYFQWLRNGFVPDSYTFVSILTACAKIGCVKSGQMCHGQAVKKEIDSVLPVQNCLITMYGSCCEDVELAGKVFDDMSQRDLVSWNSMIDVYARFGDLNDAHKLFDTMPEQNVVSWNLIIGGYLKGGNPGCALKLFRKMVETGFRGSDTTMVNILTACGRSARLKEGRSVHGSIIRNFFDLNNIILCTALIDMYGKCQRVEMAHRVFNLMVKRNLVCWNTMITAHCLHGDPLDGLDLFEKMSGRTRSKNEEQGGSSIIIPDEITFIGVLCACARAGLVLEARNYFNEMTNLFGINPSFAHIWCMANVFISVGLIEQAKEILRNLPLDNDENEEFMSNSEPLLWANVLASVRFSGDVSLGEKIAKCLLELGSSDFWYYRLLLNIYAVAGQWEDVARVKLVMKKRGVRRKPGCSLFDLKEIVHGFKVGDYCPEEMAGFIRKTGLVNS